MSERALRLTRVLAATPRQVFDAWIRPELLARWLACTPGWCGHATADVRVGGAYQVDLSDGGRIVAGASGTYLSIEPPHRLVFTWRSHGRIPVQDSVVTIELAATAGGTRLTLTHDLDPAGDAGRAHRDGWERALAALASLVQAAG